MFVIRVCWAFMQGFSLTASIQQGTSCRVLTHVALCLGGNLVPALWDTGASVSHPG